MQRWARNAKKKRQKCGNLNGAFLKRNSQSDDADAYFPGQAGWSSSYAATKVIELARESVDQGDADGEGGEPEAMTGSLSDVQPFLCLMETVPPAFSP